MTTLAVEYQEKAARENAQAAREKKRVDAINAKRRLPMPCGHSTKYDGRTCREVADTRNAEKRKG
jgi:hypothetical protein